MIDPYHIWLGIPPNEQPPDHYRLLGIQRFESDPDVISNAADARMAFVKQFEAGENAAMAAKLLNEISVARVRLLTPENRTAYARRLWTKLSKPPMPPPLTNEQVDDEYWLARQRRFDAAQRTREATPVAEIVPEPSPGPFPLSKTDLQQILHWSAQGYSKMQIAAWLGCTVAEVNRNLSLSPVVEEPSWRNAYGVPMWVRVLVLVLTLLYILAGLGGGH